MSLDSDFLINGQAVPAPDAGLELSYQDLDSEDAGRDESGYLHRSVLRRKVRTWGLSYSFLTAGEYAALLGLLTAGDTFQLTYREEGQTRQTTAYCAKLTASLRDRKQGIYQNVKCNIIEC